MFKRTFIRLFILGVLSFGVFFVLVSAQKNRESANHDSTQADTKTSTKRPSGEFIMESIIGSIFVGIK